MDLAKVETDFEKVTSVSSSNDEANARHDWECLEYFGLGRDGRRFDGRRDPYSEDQKRNVSWALRAFIPKDGLTCSDRWEIREFVEQSVPASINQRGRLVSITTQVCKNLRIWKRVDLGGVASVESLRRNGQYELLMERQGRRCATCGTPLENSRTVELDHIIPRALGGGDPLDYSNWRLLCRPCNGGKSDFFSGTAVPEYWGQPGGPVEIPLESGGDSIGGIFESWWNASGRARYALLASRRVCDSCGRGPWETALQPVWVGCPSVSTALVTCQFC